MVLLLNSFFFTILNCKDSLSVGAEKMAKKKTEKQPLKETNKLEERRAVRKPVHRQFLNKGKVHLLLYL